MEQFLFVMHVSSKPGSQAQWGKFIQMLKKGKHLIGGSALGKGIGLKGGVIKRPKTPSIGGYMVIVATSSKAAYKLAKQCPTHQNGGNVDVFPLIEDP